MENERHGALVLPWIKPWRSMGYGPDLIAQLLDALGIQELRSKWSASVGITWRGMRFFVGGGIEARTSWAGWPAGVAVASSRGLKPGLPCSFACATYPLQIRCEPLFTKDSS